MKNNSLAESESTNRLLRVVIALLLQKKNDAPQSLKQQITILNDLGMSQSEIAKIIGRESKYVSKELAGIRKKAKK